MSEGYEPKPYDGRILYSDVVTNVSNLDALKTFLLNIASNMIEGETKYICFRPESTFSIFGNARYTGFINLATLFNNVPYFSFLGSSSLGDIVSIGYYGGAWHFAKVSPSS